MESDSASQHAVKCILCGQPFKAPLKKGNVKRHFEEQHRYTFISNRPEKRTSDSATRQPSKRFKKAVLFSDFRDADDFVNNCILMHTDNALPFAFWDKASTKRMVQPYSDMYKVTISGNYFSNETFSVPHNKCIMVLMHTLFRIFLRKNIANKDRKGC